MTIFTLATRRQYRRDRSLLRGAALVEGLECRVFFSTDVLDHGKLLGTLDTYVPVGGVKTLPASTTRGSGTSAGQPGFQITLDFQGGLTPSQQAVFTQAAAKWESIITGDVPDVTNDPTYGFVDDVTIAAEGAAIDGPGKILGQAGPTSQRGNHLPITGLMMFDSDDLANIETSGLLLQVITHEMGHVLGIGTVWSQDNLATGLGGTDPRFTGTHADAEYRALSGNASTTAPIENVGADGTRDSHWREVGPASFGNELMTGTINANPNPLSRITAASLIDLGYPAVNIDAADLYTIPKNPTTAGGYQGDYTPANPLPVISALTASANTVAAGDGVQFTLTSATDDNSVATISYYRESNGIPGLQSTGTVAPDSLIGTYAGNVFYTLVNTTGQSGSYTYYARAADNFGALSAVSSTIVTVVVAPAVPSAPILLASNDHGISSTDGITNLNVLTFTGTATANATITLKNGNTTIGTGAADASGNYSVTTSTLVDGTYAVAAIASNIAGTSSASTTTTVSVDTIKPTVTLASYDREITEAVTLNFGEAVSISLTPGNVVLENLTSGTTTTAYTVATSGGQTVLKIQPTGLLPDGNYRLTVPAANLTDVAGNALAANYVFTFRQLGGDADGDGVVNFNDLVILAQNYNTAGRTFSGGNFDHNAGGNVNFDDLVILAQNYNKSLPSLLLAPAMALPETASKSKATPRSPVAASVIS